MSGTVLDVPKDKEINNVPSLCTEIYPAHICFQISSFEFDVRSKNIQNREETYGSVLVPPYNFFHNVNLCRET